VRSQITRLVLKAIWTLLSENDTCLHRDAANGSCHSLSGRITEEHE
jgi:hypothetical protein